MWTPIIQAFHAKYPEIEVQTLDLGTREIVERYFAEANAGLDTASLIVTTFSEITNDFAEAEAIVEYVPPSSEILPDWSKPVPGAYTFSVDPVVMAWNKLAIAEGDEPSSFQGSVDLVREDYATYDGRITTYPPDLNIYQHNGFKTRIEFDGEAEAWEAFELLGPATRLESSTGSMIEKIVSGEYLVAYFAAAAPVFTALADPAMGEILGWSFVEDGTIAAPRLMAIPEGAASPASAKIFMDFVLWKTGKRPSRQEEEESTTPTSARPSCPKGSTQSLVSKG